RVSELPQTCVDGRRVSWPAFGFALSLIVPSTVVVDKDLGATGVAGYVLVGIPLLYRFHQTQFTSLTRALSDRGAAVLSIALVLALAGAFSVGYPLANSGLYGSGSDRDEHINIGAAELLHARYPY